MIPLDERDILTSLHSGPLEKPLWNTFLARLKRRVGAEFCGMYFRQGDAHITESTEIAVGPTYPDDLRAKYNADFHVLDPIPYDDLRPGR
ncbi:MAG TPA: LuxR family transcriptional regulator, partial [Pedomonas sp.]